MAEIPSNPQYFGQADASHIHSADIPNKKDFNLNTEQQQMLGSLEAQEKKLQGDIFNATKDAGMQLYELKGKELVKAGTKQLVLGLVLGQGIEGAAQSIANINAMFPALKKHIEWLNPNAKVIDMSDGLVVGGEAKDAARDAAHEIGSKMRFIRESMTQDMKKPALMGKLFGYELTPLIYQELIKGKNMPKLEWIDWVGGHVGFIPITIMMKQRLPVGELIGQDLSQEVPVDINMINSVTFGGLRNIAKGLWQIRQEQKLNALVNKLPVIEMAQAPDIDFSNEQVEVTDAMESNAATTAETIATARETAGKQLVKLRGKELAQAGVKQIALGVGIGKGSEIIGVAVGKAAGSLGALVKHGSVLFNTPDISAEDLKGADTYDEIFAKSLGLGSKQSYENMTTFIDHATEGALKAKKTGKIVGFELSSVLYNQFAKGRNLPSVEWFDMLVGQLGLIPLRMAVRGVPLNVNPVNGITFSGLRNTVLGVWQMGSDNWMEKRYGKLPVQN